MEWFQKGCQLSLVVYTKKVVKSTFGTLVYHFERQTARKNFFLPKNTESSTLNVGFYFRNLQIAAFHILISYFMESELKKILIDSWWCMNAVIIETVETLETRYSIFLSRSNVIFFRPITLKWSSHMIQSVNNNPWCHRKDPQTSQVNKCPDIFRKCPRRTKLRIT